MAYHQIKISHQRAFDGIRKPIYKIQADVDKAIDTCDQINGGKAVPSILNCLDPMAQDD